MNNLNLNLIKLTEDDLGAVSTILPVGAEFYVFTAIYELFSPDNNILIKYANNITENDMHRLVGIIVADYVYCCKNSKIDEIRDKLEYEFNFTKRELDTYIGAYRSFTEEKENKDLDTSKIDHPTAKFIIESSHADNRPILYNI